MRSSIARGALALLSVAAITGCQNGSTWSPTWWNPFHTTPATTSSYFFGSGAAGPAFDARHYSSPGTATATARPPSPYSPYSSSTPSATAAAEPYGTAAMARLQPVRTPRPVASSGSRQHVPETTTTASRLPGRRVRRQSVLTIRLAANSACSDGIGVSGQYPYARSCRLPVAYPRAGTPYSATPHGTYRDSATAAARCLATATIARLPRRRGDMDYGCSATPSYGVPRHRTTVRLPRRAMARPQRRAMAYRDAGLRRATATPGYGTSATPGYGTPATPDYGNATRRVQSYTPATAPRRQAAT